MGGMQLRAFDLYTGLAARGHEIHVLTTSHPERPLHDVENGIHVHYLPGCEPTIYSDEYFALAKSKLLELEKDRPFDVIHSDSSAARFEIGGRLPVVGTWHGFIYCSYRTAENLAL